MVKCQVCGEEIGDAKFCNNCGSKVEETTIEEEKAKVFCVNCGKELDEGTEFCNECGTPVNGQITVNNNKNTNPSSKNNVNKTTVTASDKNPVLAAVLSFFIVGLGQIYLGLNKKGIILFVAAVISICLFAILIGELLFLIIWIYAIYDAYNSAGKLNRGEFVEDTIDFNNLV